MPRTPKDIDRETSQPPSTQTARARPNPCAQCEGLASDALSAASPSCIARTESKVGNVSRGWQ